MHQAADKLPVSLFPRIKSVVMFGDPNLRLGRLGHKFPAALQPKVLEVCAKNDPVSAISLYIRVLECLKVEQGKRGRERETCILTI